MITQQTRRTLHELIAVIETLAACQNDTTRDNVQPAVDAAWDLLLDNTPSARRLAQEYTIVRDRMRARIGKVRTR